VTEVAPTPFYAGIGSRKTPPLILGRMTGIAQGLGLRGWALRSGNANGADKAFHEGAVAGGCPAQVYLPWPGYNGAPRCTGPVLRDGATHWVSQPTPAAFTLAAQYHPAWHACSSGAQRLHARNAHQILGWSLNSPVRFVLCWTSDGVSTGAQTGRQTGGTGGAIRIASAYGVPVFNLADSQALSQFTARLPTL
jgi:hypothetical protein